MKVFTPTLLAVAAAFTVGGASAQLKPPPGLNTPAPTLGTQAPSAPAATQPNAVTVEAGKKVGAATTAASGWLLLLDRRDWGRAWETSAAMFRKAVPLASWMDGIPKVRDVGDFVSREPVESMYKTTLPGHPEGQYVTVVFNSKFSKKDKLEEIVTTVLEPDGKWRITGYQTR